MDFLKKAASEFTEQKPAQQAPAKPEGSAPPAEGSTLPAEGSAPAQQQDYVDKGEFTLSLSVHSLTLCLISCRSTDITHSLRLCRQEERPHRRRQDQ